MKILYVEDETRDIDFTRRALARSAPAIMLDVANTLGVARDKLATPDSAYDLVLLDLRLPDGTGFDLLKEIREQNLSVAVIILTGMGDEDTAVNALKAGADDYITKKRDYLMRLPALLKETLERFRAEAARKAQPLSVLYVEHNPSDIDLTRRHLSRYASHIHIDVAHTGTEALQKLLHGISANKAYHVLLLDYHLPGMTGLELLKTLYQEHQIRTPTVLVTGHGNEEVAVQALRLGASNYVVKNPGYLFKLPAILENAHYSMELAHEQEKLAKSENRFRLLAENARDIIYRLQLKPTPVFEYISPSVTRILGYTPEEFYADPDLSTKLVHPDDQLVVARLGERDYAKGSTILRFIRKDGAIIWIEQHITPIHDEKGDLVALEGIARDITLRKQAEDSVKLQAAALEAAANAIVITDQNGVIQWVNSAFTTLTGYTLDESKEHNLRDLVRSGRHDAAFYAALWDTILASKVWHGEIINRRKDGSLYAEEQTITPVVDQHGEISHFISIKQDITQRKEAERRLQDSEASFRLLFENNPHPMWVYDLESLAFLKVNQSAIAHYGYSHDEFLKMTLPDIHPVEDRIRLIEYIEGDRPALQQSGEWRHTLKNGEIIDVEITSHTLDFGGNRASLVVAQDITERKQARIAEREQHQLVEALRNTAAALIAAVDLDTVMHTLLENVSSVVPNDAANIMLIENDRVLPVFWRGYRPESIPYIEEISFQLMDTLNLREMFFEQSPFLASYTDQYPGWRHQPVTEWVKSYVAAPIRSHGQVIGFLSLDSEKPGFFTEIHAQRLQSFADQASVAIEHAQLYEQLQRHTEELERRVDERTAELQRSEARYRAIIEDQTDMVCRYLPGGVLTFVNQTYCQHFNRTSEELLGRSHFDLVPSEERAKLEEYVSTLDHENPVTTIDLQEVTMDGQARWVHWSDRILFNEKGDFIEYQGVGRDITERKLAEVKLQHMLEQAMKLSELRSRYIAMAAHDLRNPLAAVQSSIEVLHYYRDKLTDEKIQEKYTNIYRSINLMVNMLNDVLTIGQAESGTLKFEPSEVAPEEFCKSIIEEVKQFTNTSQQIDFFGQGNYGIAYLDVKLLRHILTNLLSNAIKYSPDNTPITLDLECDSDRIMFRVQDRGIGIPKTDQVRLFEAFHRAGNVGSVAGTGLGLAIVKQSVDLHGGTIMFDSQENVGTTFFISLPRYSVKHV